MKRLTGLLALLAISASAQEAPLQNFDEYINKALQDWNIPGAEVVIVKDDKVILAKGYGQKAVGSNEKVDEHTIFNIASNTKAFTAAALAILVDEGKIKWDDLVTKYIPSFEMSNPEVTNNITIRDLITHRNGLGSYSGDIVWWGSDYSREEVVKRVRYINQSIPFRSAPRYQNIPYITAGLIIEKVTGKTWEEFVHERILKPLQMNDSSTDFKSALMNQNIITPHMVLDEKLIPIAWRDLSAGGPAIGINSNAFDMAQWLRFQLNNGKFDGKQLISERQMNEMQMPQMAIPFTNPSDQPKLKTNFRAYGLGWTLREYAGQKVVQDLGLTDGMSSMVTFMPDQHLGIAVFANIHDNNTFAPAIAYRIFDAYLGLEPTDWSNYYLKRTIDSRAAAKKAEEKAENDRLKDTKPMLELANYAGIYSNDLYGDVELIAQDNKLIIKMLHSPTYIGELRHWQNETFQILWKDPIAQKTFMTFKLEGSKTISFSMNMNDFIEGTTYTYLRKK